MDFIYQDLLIPVQCHPEQSEGSHYLKPEILRTKVLRMTSWVSF